MAEGSGKLTKKEKKALEFKNKAKGKAVEEPTDENGNNNKKRSREDDKNDDSTKDATTEGEEPKKKRKTRRGKKGKGQGGSGPRFLLFVGNLPYNVTEAELKEHFAAAKPDTVRIRTEKGIAFLEFNANSNEIQHQMEVALRMHHSYFKGRKINVELTVGGGGNSSTRLEKIKEKNNKVDVERKGKIEEKKKQVREKKEKAAPKIDLTNVHPDRAKMLQ